MATEGRAPWRVGAASFVGTAVQYYDFSIYSTAAALVFPAVFFPSSDPLLGTVAAFGTFAAGFLASPLGAVLFGHLGDRYGRRTTLWITLVLMGGATIGIGLLPGFGAIGVAAPILLVLLRVVQGAAFGGEWGGAVLLAYESAPDGRKGLLASLPQAGPAAGVLLGNLAFLPVLALGPAAVSSWAWRVPFLASVVLVGLGLAVRLSVAETADFVETQRVGTVERLPLMRVVRRYPREVLLVAGGYLGFAAVPAVAVTFMLGHASVVSAVLLWAVLAGNVAQLVTVPISGALADRWGPRPLVLAGSVTAAAGIVLVFAAVQSGDVGMIVAGYLLGFGVLYCVGYGAQPVAFAEVFDAPVRYSGIAVGTAIGTVLGSGFGPLVATGLVHATGTSWSAAGYVVLTLALSFACLAVLTRPTRRPVEVTT
ncbi:MFS transporter [Pseudonocardia sp. MH-G8]|uniref:MFS transporter n=1 Tax=Pseudonocardia sp. MH-G8 TaxID=1854588 RepID=UPI001303FF8F|nr:MFS transporter [Pseudonocardia sp. MH-G8]